MAEEPTPKDEVENEERGSQTDLALLVAALGGGPGDRDESGVRHRFARERTPEGFADQPRAEAA